MVLPEGTVLGCGCHVTPHTHTHSPLQLYSVPLLFCRWSHQDPSPTLGLPSFSHTPAQAACRPWHMNTQPTAASICAPAPPWRLLLGSLLPSLPKPEVQEPAVDASCAPAASPRHTWFQHSSPASRPPLSTRPIFQWSQETTQQGTGGQHSTARVTVHSCANLTGP